MVGKMRVVFLALLVLSMAGAAQADTLVPLGMGYSATYAGQWGGSYTATMQVTGTKTVDGNQYWIMQVSNWDGDSNSGLMDMRSTSDALYVSGSDNPVFKTGDVGTAWIDDNGRNTQIVAIGPLTVAAGTFTNVYEICRDFDHEHDAQTFEYWKPGVGLLEEFNPVYHNNGPKTMELTSYATPVPPGLVLFGSGLVGLLGFRRLRRL